MNLKTIIATKSRCYTANIANKITHTPKGFFVHSTGANNATLKRYVQPDDGTIGVNPNGNSFNSTVSDVCPHFVIGKLANGNVATVQILPLDMPCWCSGSGAKGNANFLGYLQVEIAEDALTDKAYFGATYKEAAELGAYLVNKYKIPVAKPSVGGVSGGITCHKEAYDLGFASGHGDPLHWWSKYGRTMDDFRADVKKAFSGTVPATAATPVISPYNVNIIRVTAATLNIRKEPGTKSSTGADIPITGTIKKGECYTIVDEAVGTGAQKWGKLKSGAGWIALDYTEKR